MIKELLLQLLQDSEELYSKVCKVDSVNGNTCDVSPIDGDAPILDVRLVADLENENRFILIPAIGSYVIVSFLTKEIAFVSMVSEVSQIYFKVMNTEWNIDGDGFLLKKGDETLLKLFKDTLDAILQEKHMTNSGPTVDLTPDSKARFQGLKNRFETLLKGS